jgi:hypothetical protein
MHASTIILLAVYKYNSQSRATEFVYHERGTRLQFLSSNHIPLLYFPCKIKIHHLYV